MQPSTSRSNIKRLPQRGSYDRDVIYSILDEAYICHIGFAVEGQPFVIPTAYARVDEQIYIHGSPASRMLRSLQTSVDICVTVTLLDGLVLARSAFHHSMNYRSVVIFGQARLVSDPAEKEAALHAFTNQMVADRWEECRPVKPQEIAGTSVLALPIAEASAKIRSGPPTDEAADYGWPTWAGVLPLKTQIQAPIADPQQSPELRLSNAVRQILSNS